jgi:fluoroquinolone resistance protein
VNFSCNSIKKLQDIIINKNLWNSKKEYPTSELLNMIENKSFERIDYTLIPLDRGEYENCSFENCNFYSSDLSHITFRACKFIDCDFSLATILNTGLNDVCFKDCKLLGVQFETCNPFLLAVDFENCLLKLSVFQKLKLKKTSFKNCNLQEADFSETDLSAAVFDNCDFNRAIFYKTLLEKADFRTAFNYSSIDLENNRIKKAKFSRSGVVGLLDKYGIELFND